MKTVCVIPTYKARATIVAVVERALAFSACVVVVEDACPEHSADAVDERFGTNDRIIVIRRPRNGGVGAATKTGIERALQLDASVIVKIDADDQMDASRIPELEGVLAEHPDVAMVKGNRFTDSSVLDVMPRTRFLGNAVLSILAKFASGYWSLLDPTNGFLAFNARILRTLKWRAFADSYFFELSVLCALGLRREKLAEVEMTAIYGTAPSSLSIRRVIVTFPPLLLRAFAKRVLTQYFLLDFNVGSLCMLTGTLLALAGLVLGSQQWYISIHTGVARPTGVIMIVALLLMFGGQLLFGALLYDVLLTSSIVRAVPTGWEPRPADENAGAAKLGVTERALVRREPLDARRMWIDVAIPLIAAVGTLLWYVFVATNVYSVVPAAVEYATTQAHYALAAFGGPPRNTESLILTASFVFSAIAPGYALTAPLRIRWSGLAERVMVSAVVGLAAYTVAFMALGAIGLLTPGPLFALTLVCFAGSMGLLAREFRRPPVERPAAPVAAAMVASVRRSALDIALGGGIVFFAFMALLAALNYENRFDASWYHLAEARRWALEGGIVDLVRVNRSLTAGLPHYQEVLYAGIISMFGVAAAKALSWFDLVLALGSIGLFCGRLLRSRRWGLVACLVFASTPIVGFSAGTASNDLPLAALTVLALYGLLRWTDQPRQYGWLVIAGALAGYSTGVKTTGYFTGVVCVGFLAVVALARSRSDARTMTGSVFRRIARGVAAFGAGALLFAAPGMIQAAAWTRDPFFPLFPKAFASPYEIPYLVAPNWYGEYIRHVPEHLWYLIALPWYLTFDNNSVIGPAFVVLVPAVVVALLFSRTERRVVVSLAAFSVAWAALFNLTPTLWARYAEPIGPFASMLAAYPLFVRDRQSFAWSALRASAVFVLVLTVALNNPFTVVFQTKAMVPGNEGTANYDWNYLYRNYPSPVGGPAPRSKAATIAYLNDHFSPSVRVYEDAELFPWTLYADPQLYEPSPDARAWTLTSADAVSELRRSGVSYVATYARNMAKLAASPLGPHLKTLWVSPLDDSTANPGTAIVLSRFE